MMLPKKSEENVYNRENRKEGINIIFLRNNVYHSALLCS